MNKKALIWIVAVVIFLGAISYLWLNSRVCYDKGGVVSVFEASRLKGVDNLATFRATDGPLVGRISESATCSDKGTFEIYREGQWQRVDKEQFNSYLNDYNSQCDSCLVQQGFVGNYRYLRTYAGTGDEQKDICTFANQTSCVAVERLLN